MNEYNWREKAAAAVAEDQIDREAAEKAFMDQAYALVANKGKALFRDPFRIGFEIVDTNEKFTKMHGIFAFRCGDTVLSVPVFFVNGDVLGGDSVYRGDVKRFSPFTDKWCAYLVRKASTAGGQMVDRNTQTQADAYMQRLSYPQFGKSASFGGAFDRADARALWDEMVKAAWEALDVPLLTPQLLKSGAYNADDLAAVMGDSEIVSRYAARIYANSDFTPDVVKSASPHDIPNLYRITDINLCKTAAQREEVASTGTAWDDKRTDFTPKHVTEEIPSREMIELQGGGSADVILSCEDKFVTEEAVVLSCRDVEDISSMLSEDSSGGKALVYFPGSKKIAKVSRRKPVFGFAKDRETKTIEIGSAVAGKHYILVDEKVTTVLDRPFTVESIVSVQDGKVLAVSPRIGNSSEIIFRADATRCEPGRGFYNNNYRLLEVASEKKEGDTWEGFDPSTEDRLMSTAEVDRWIRGVGTADLKSDDYKVLRDEGSGLFSMSHADESVSEHKVAASLSHDELVAHLAVRCDLPVATAVVFAKKAHSAPVAFRIYTSAVEKNAFVTRVSSPETWTTGYDPILGAKTDWPQQRDLTTITPQRRRQQARYGDHFVQDSPYEAGDPDEDGLPETDLLSMSPDLLAQKADQLGLPHILDHQVFSQLANRPTNSIAQVRKYLPGLETGVDHYARILFLIRYRPSEFEEAYGKEETQNMEEDISSLFQLSGDSLLRLLKRFDKDRYSSETQA